MRAGSEGGREREEARDDVPAAKKACKKWPRRRCRRERSGKVHVYTLAHMTGAARRSSAKIESPEKNLKWLNAASRKDR